LTVLNGSAHSGGWRPRCTTTSSRYARIDVRRDTVRRDKRTLGREGLVYQTVYGGQQCRLSLGSHSVQQVSAPWSQGAREASTAPFGTFRSNCTEVQDVRRRGCPYEDCRSTAVRWPGLRRGLDAVLARQSGLEAAWSSQY